MSSESIWICDKCGTKGDRTQVPGIVTARDDRVRERDVYLDLCVDCITELLSLIAAFMNPKREYPAEEEKPKSESKTKKKQGEETSLRSSLAQRT